MWCYTSWKRSSWRNGIYLKILIRKDAESLTGAVHATGKDHKAQFLIEYSKLLNQAISSFDVETLEILKNEFPKFIEKLKNREA